VNSYDDIATCAAEDAATRGRLAADTDALTDYEAVLRARVALAECMVAASWTPIVRRPAPPGELLTEPPGSLEARYTEA
jgi:hypothetical protein